MWRSHAKLYEGLKGIIRPYKDLIRALYGALERALCRPFAGILRALGPGGPSGAHAGTWKVGGGYAAPTPPPGISAYGADARAQGLTRPLKERQELYFPSWEIRNVKGGGYFKACLVLESLKSLIRPLKFCRALVLRFSVCKASNNVLDPCGFV